MEPVRRVEDLASGLLTAKQLRQQVLETIAARVPHDAYVFPLTDPVTMVSTSPLADVPMLPWPRLPELIRWRYLTRLNRVDDLVGGPARSLCGSTTDPAQSALWTEVQRGLGVVDTASVGFADRYGVWGYLELWRTSGRFDMAELDLLTALQGSVTAGLRAAVARIFTDADQWLGRVGPAVVVLGPDLHVRSQTDEAAATLLRLLPPDEPVTPVPASAYNIGAALLAQEAGVPVGEPWSRVHLGGSRWVTVRASRLGSDVAVSIEPSTPAERADLFARAHGMSARETQVLELLIAGLDTREIAGALFLSEHTVNDHVKAALAKSGVRTRSVMLSRALGA